MTIARNLLAKGYFPKEVPSSFFSADFAAYASTRNGRSQLRDHRKSNAKTEGVTFALAQPSRDNRLLTIPHPSGYAGLVREVAKAFSRLLAKANRSPFTRSAPRYLVSNPRPI